MKVDNEKLITKRCEKGVYHSYNKGFFVFAEKGDDVSFVHTSWNKGIETWRYPTTHRADSNIPFIFGDFSEVEFFVLKSIIDDGGSFSTAVTVFPSTTGPAYIPFISGVFPGISNMPGIRWFDKVKFSKNINSLDSHRSYVGIEGLMFNRDIKKSQPTIFAIIPNSRSIFNEITRGLKSSFDLTKLSKGYYKLKSHFSGSQVIDDLAFKKLLESINSCLLYTSDDADE